MLCMDCGTTPPPIRATAAAAVGVDAPLTVTNKPLCSHCCSTKCGVSEDVITPEVPRAAWAIIPGQVSQHIADHLQSHVIINDASGNIARSFLVRSIALVLIMTRFPCAKCVEASDLFKTDKKASLATFECTCIKTDRLCCAAESSILVSRVGVLSTPVLHATQRWLGDNDVKHSMAEYTLYVAASSIEVSSKQLAPGQNSLGDRPKKSL